MQIQSGVGGAISYIEWGDPHGELVVCLHGFPDLPHTWSHLGERLGDAGYHVVCPWLPGYAPSKLEGAVDFDDVVRDLMALVGELAQQEQAHLVGHDWGAVVSYRMLQLHPTSFASATALSVPHPAVFLKNLGSDPVQLRRSWYLLFFQLGSIAERAVVRNNFALIERLWRDWSPGWSPRAGYLRDVKACLERSGKGPLGYYRATRTSATRRIFSELNATDATIAVPTLYMHGERDGCIGPRLSAGQAQRFSRGVRTVRVQGAGHFVQLEAPAQTTTEIVRWISQHTRVTARTRS